jgi:hypothetical protein
MQAVDGSRKEQGRPAGKVPPAFSLIDFSVFIVLSFVVVVAVVIDRASSSH